RAAGWSGPPSPVGPGASSDAPSPALSPGRRHHLQSPRIPLDLVDRNVRVDLLAGRREAHLLVDLGDRLDALEHRDEFRPVDAAPLACSVRQSIDRVVGDLRSPYRV